MQRAQQGLNFGVVCSLFYIFGNCFRHCIGVGKIMTPFSQTHSFGNAKAQAWKNNTIKTKWGTLSGLEGKQIRLVAASFFFWVGNRDPKAPPVHSPTKRGGGAGINPGLVPSTLLRGRGRGPNRIGQVVNEPHPPGG